MKPALLVAALASCMLAQAAPDDVKDLRERVLKADKPKEKAEAYQKFFEKVGKKGLTELTKDEDTGIALQAAWEVHKTPKKRPTLVEGRVDDFYDPDDIGKFVEFLKGRTKAPVPDWWAKAVVVSDFSPGVGHAFPYRGNLRGPKTRKSKAGFSVPEGAALEEKGENLVYSATGRSVEFPKKTLDQVTESCVGVLGEKRSVLAGYDLSGCSFDLLAFEGGGGKPAWKSVVWAAGRVVYTGPWPPSRNWVEVTEKDGTVFVFGAEGAGMYAEAFDLATGKCKFRFCTCYWFNFSEKWDLK